MALPRGRSIVWVLDAVALVLLVSPLVDLLGAIWPARMSEVSWRFGAFGLTTSALVSPILGFALLKVAGVLLDQRGVVRAVAIIDLLLLLLLLVGLGFFALDYLQLRATLAPASLPQYDMAGFKAALNGLIELIVLGWMGVAGLRASGRHAKPTASHGSRGEAGLIVGMPPGEPTRELL
jgi:hypothetical protein